MERWKEDLLQLPGRQDELDWMRERLETLGVCENTLLSAAVMHAPPGTVADAVNMLSTLDRYKMIEDVGQYAELGRFYLEQMGQKKLPDELEGFVDLEGLGRKYEDMMPGLFTDGCYVLYPQEPPPSLYDGKELPADRYDWSLRLKLASPSLPDGLWVRLPDYEDIDETGEGEITLALKRLGVKTVQECTLLDARCRLPGITGIMEYSDLADLIYDGQNLGILLDEQDQGRVDYTAHYLAALEYEDCHDIKFALDIGNNLRCYDLIPAEELTEYGIASFQKTMRLPAEMDLSGLVDFESVAKQDLLQRDGQEVLGGKAYIARNEKPFHREYTQEPTGMTME